MRAGPLHRGFSRLCGGWPPIGERATSVDEDCYCGGSGVRATQAFLLPVTRSESHRTWNVRDAHFDSWVSVSIFTCAMLMNFTYHMPA